MGSSKKLREDFGRKYAIGRFSNNYQRTLGLDMSTHEISLQNGQVKLIVMDAAGEETFGKLRLMYYRRSSGGVIVYDCNKEKFEQKQVNEFHIEFRRELDDSRVPVAIVGSKINAKPQKTRSKKVETINTHYYEIDSTKKEEITRIYVELADVVINKSILEYWEIEKIDPAILPPQLIARVRKCSIINYWDEKTLGYCSYNCDDIPKTFIKTYNEKSKEKFKLFPQVHLNQCLFSCPLFSILVDLEQVNKFQNYLRDKSNKKYT